MTSQWASWHHLLAMGELWPACVSVRSEPHSSPKEAVVHTIGFRFGEGSCPATAPPGHPIYNIIDIAPISVPWWLGLGMKKKWASPSCEFLPGRWHVLGGASGKVLVKEKSHLLGKKKRFLHFHRLQAGAASSVFCEPLITNLSVKCVVF